MLTFVDLFCGAGGSSTGLVEAGWILGAAANHSKTAIATHAANHPDAEHLAVDISAYDMRHLPRARALWASPICTEISPAGGRRRSPRGQDALPMPWEEYGAVEAESWERTRATAFDVIRATEIWRYDVVMCENVVEFVTDWPLFDWWRSGMHHLGYTSQVISVNSAHVGDAGNLHAPQWRDRIYVVFVREGITPPDLTVRPLSRCAPCGTDVEAVQSWRPGRWVGKYRQQYDYRCPNTTCAHAIVEPYVRPAADIIDWSNPGRRIGDRPRTERKPEGLAPKTMARIRAGLAAYPLDPSLITINHGGHTGRVADPFDAPMPTRATKIGDGLLVPVGGQRNVTCTSTDDPMRTRMANPKGYEALLSAPFVVELRRNGKAHPMSRPLATISAGGNHHGLVIPYRKSTPRPTSHPVHTLSTVDSAGLLTGPAVDPADCHFRMVQPREQLSAQRFPADYIVKGTRGEQTAQAGNAVSVNVARWIGERVKAVL